MINKKIYNIEELPEVKAEMMELLSQLEVVCNRNRIPFFFSFASSNSEEKTSYYSKMINPAVYDYQLTDDKFPDFANVINGFKTYFASSTTDDTEYMDLINEVSKIQGQNNTDMEDEYVYEEDYEEITSIADEEEGDA